MQSTTSAAPATTTPPLSVTPTTLLAAFSHVVDPRRQASVAYPLAVLLALAVTAMLANQHSVLAIAEWAARQSAAVLAPLGFNWQIAVALIPGMAAREVAVAALGTVYAIEGGKEAAEQIGQMLATKWSLATALSLLAWYIFAPQCASTLAVIRRETGSWKWMAVTFGYMFALAYVASLATYNIAVSLGAG